MTPEGRAKKRVKDLLVEHEAFFNMPVPSGFGESMLDFVGHHRGLYFEIEVKSEIGELTARQEYRAKNIIDSGAKAFVIYGVAGKADRPDTWPGYTELEQWLSRK